MLVLIVGCLGLLSNLLGLFLFHEHSHGHDNAHNRLAGTHKLTDAEAGYGDDMSTKGVTHTNVIADEGGNIADVLPQTTTGAWSKSASVFRSSSEMSSHRMTASNGDFKNTDEDSSTIAASKSTVSAQNTAANGPWRHRRHTSGSRSGFGTFEDIHVHPASFRNEIIAASRLDSIDSGSDLEFDDEVIDEANPRHREIAPLIRKSKSNGSNKASNSSSGAEISHHHHHSWHKDHIHTKKNKEANDNGHSHGDLNMRGVFLHVTGDALGNLGVIGSALIIWLTRFSWRYYADPAISLVITVIILGSAIPLCKAASRILLQAVPQGLSIDDIKEDIKQLPGILDCHHLHVWQLSDTKLVASLHIKVKHDFKGKGSARYMDLARAVRQCLHEYGIHSSTIQPEFCLDGDHQSPISHSDRFGDSDEAGANETTMRSASKSGSRAASLPNESETCLLDCGDECGERGQCCIPASVEQDLHDGSDHTH